MIYGYCTNIIKYSFSQSSRILSLYPEAQIVKDKDTPLHSLIPSLKDGDKVIVVDILGLCSEKVIDDSESVFADIYNMYQKVFMSGADIEVLDSPTFDSFIFRSAILHNHTRDGSYAEMAVSEILEQQFRMVIKNKLDEYIGIQTNKNTVKKHTGNQKGTKYNTRKERPSKEFIIKNHIDFGGVLTNEECIRELGISRNTFFKYKKELLASLPSPITPEPKDDIEIKKDVPEMVPDAFSQPSLSALDKEAEDEKGKEERTLKKAHTKPTKKKDKGGDEIEGQSSIFDFL